MVIMKNMHRTGEEGFIPLLLTVLFMVIIGVALVYVRVLRARHT